MNNIKFKAVIIFLSAVMIVFGPFLYYKFIVVLPCKKNLSSEKAIVVLGKSSHEIIYMSNGKGINFNYTYNDSVFNTGYQDYFRRIPDSEFFIYIRIDSQNPDCYEIIYDSIYENDSIIIEYVKKHASIDVVVTPKKKLIKNCMK